MKTPLPPRYNQTVKLSKNRRQFQIAALRVLLNKALQTLTETADDCEKTFFNTITFHRFHVHLLKLYSPHLIDQFDSDSMISTLLFHVINQFSSLDTFHEEINTDPGKFKNEVTNVFTRTDFNSSPETENSTNHRFNYPSWTFQQL